MTEADLLRDILRAVNTGDTRVFRNQVGSYQLKDGRWLTSGLCVGSSDLIGFRSVTITPTHVGQKIAQFLAIECKSPTGRVRPEQIAFLAAIEKCGGIAILARSLADVETKL